jgi:hypothetical protein
VLPPPVRSVAVNRLGARTAIQPAAEGATLDYTCILLFSFRLPDRSASPRPRPKHGGGVNAITKKLVGPLVGHQDHLLRPRCDPRRFEPLPIEIVANQKVTQPLSHRIREERSRDLAPRPLSKHGWGGCCDYQKTSCGPSWVSRRFVATTLRCARFRAAAN